MDASSAITTARGAAGEQAKQAAAEARQEQAAAAAPVPALQKGDAFLASLRARGGADVERIADNFAALEAFVKDAAARMRIAEPVLLVDNTSQSRYAAGMAAASTNKSGTVYFIIVDGKQLVSILASDHDLRWFKVVVCHEMDHIKRGDVAPASLGAPSDPDRIESQEIRADIEGGFYSGDPAPMVAYFKSALIADAAKYKGQAPLNPVFHDFDPTHPTAAQIREGSLWRKEQDPLHAEPLERYFVFELLTKMMAGGSASVDGLAAEDGVVRKTVRQEMQDASLPSWAASTPR